MSSPTDAASLLERARAARDPLAARMWLAAAVTEVGLRHGIRAVVTGGTAVDFYVAGAVGTSDGWPVAWRGSADVDVVALAAEGGIDARRDLFHALETDLGLKPSYEGVFRTIEVPGYPFGLEIVGDALTHDPTGARVVTVRLEGRHAVFLRGPEDVVLAYVEGAVATRHRGDWTRALAVFATQRARIDLAYLRTTAARLRLSAPIEEIIAGRPMPA
ncbi:MAG TPA: hypothetical protein VM370_02175 [Candidatus Thermoplasmatota archaeon]|nr:hypothetical protein [Candidatus Thermoplasmatota archaeon]